MCLNKSFKWDQAGCYSFICLGTLPKLMAVFRWKDFFCEDSITLTISPCFDNIENHNRMHKQTIAVLTVPKKI